MKVLVAEDDSALCELLSTLVESWGYEVASANDGEQAWHEITSPNAPKLLILDWLMPKLSGVDICHKIKSLKLETPPYIIMLTSMDSKENIIEGLQSGADDFITKPFDANELEARLSVGKRVVMLQSALAERVAELQTALNHVKKLQGIVPICSHCHSIRNDQESWQRIEQYISEHTDAQFSHGICPDCMKKHYSEILE